MWISKSLVNRIFYILWISCCSLTIFTNAQTQFQQNTRQLNVQPLRTTQQINNNNNNNQDLKNFQSDSQNSSPNSNNNNFNNNNDNNFQGRLNPAEQTAMGQELFALETYHNLVQQVHQQYQPFNLVISPFSIWSLLVLITEGAAGNTFKQLSDVLGLPNDLTYVQEPYRQIQTFLKLRSSTTEITSVQVLCFDRKLLIEQKFSEKVRNVYNADILPVNFQNSNEALNRVEMFMRDKTNGKIENILSEAEIKDAQMIMISAITFESQWRYPFNKSFTTEEIFYDGQGNPAGKVNMMFQRGAFAYTALAELDSHLLELPYGSGDLSMILLLPRKNVSLPTVVENLKKIPLSKIFEELHKAEIEYEDDEVEVHLPRFSVTSDLSLQEPLETMGLTDLFQPSFSDLSNISKNPTFLSTLIHKVTIQVDEEGTVATAVTAGVFANKATPPRFYANRPFLYMIVEKRTNTMLFLGQLEDPLKFKL